MLTVMKRPMWGAMLILLLAMYPAGTRAQETSVAALSRQLGQAETDIASVNRTLDGRVDATQGKLLRAKANAARGSTGDVADQLQQQLALVEARIAELGPVTAGVAEAPEIRQQRTALASERTALDSTVKRAKLLGVEAQQIVDEIDRSQAEQLGQKLSTRYISPLAPSFWGNVLAAAPRDVRRVGEFLDEGRRQVRARSHGGLPWPALAGLILAVALILPARLLARRAGQRFLIEGAPGHDVRRSAFALWRVVVGTAAPLLASVAFVQGLRWSGLLPERWNDLLEATVAAAGFGGYVAAVAGALTMRSQPAWRIAAIDDDAAARLRPQGWILTALAVVGILWDAFNRTVGASTPALVATQATQALLHVLLIGNALVIVGRLRAERASVGGAAPLRAGVGLVLLLGWIAVATALASLLIGFIGFSLFLVQVVIWGMILLASLYLLTTAVDDLATSVFTRDSRLASTLTGALGIRASAIDQFGVLLSALLRVTLVLLGLGLLLSPFGAGSGPMAVFGRLGALSQGVEVGGVAISPGAVLRGIVVLVVGLALVRLFMNWLERRYLPITDLDGSGRNSVSLVARYLGIAIASIWALASLGIGVERIALLLSALSVGIGFGLQAITQNFVSGLILLAERPIKIGDLVRVGSDEGDVRRISVRSTEIELADHSTLIVPNSELITKSVLNKTLAGPHGRLQIQFSVPLEADVERALALTLAAFAAAPDVLADPAPVAFVDSIADGRVLLNCFGHVASPRTAYPTRSAVLRAILRDLRSAGIELGTVPQRLEMVAMPEVSAPSVPAGAGAGAGAGDQPIMRDPDRFHAS